MTAEPITDEKLIEKLRNLVDNQTGGDALVLVQRQLFNRTVGRLVSLLARLTAERERAEKAESQRSELDAECQQSMRDIAMERSRAEAAEAKLTAAEAEAARLMETLTEARKFTARQAGMDAIRIYDLLDAALTPSRPNTEQEG